MKKSFKGNRLVKAAGFIADIALDFVGEIVLEIILALFT